MTRPPAGCHRTPDCRCSGCEYDRRPTNLTGRTEWAGNLLVNHEQPQCPCENTGRTTAACPYHGPADTAGPPVPRGWE